MAFSPLDKKYIVLYCVITLIQAFLINKLIVVIPFRRQRFSLNSLKGQNLQSCISSTLVRGFIFGTDKGSPDNLY